MIFKRVSSLIEYLEKFNPDARVLTDMSFSWSKTGAHEDEDARETTDILYVYGDYHPSHMDEQEYFDLKDYLLYELDEKYNIYNVSIRFDDDGCDDKEVILTVKYFDELTFTQRQCNHYNLILDVLEYCRVNDCEELMDKMTILYVPTIAF